MQLLAELSGRLAGWVQAQAQQGSDFPARQTAALHCWVPVTEELPG